MYTLDEQLNVLQDGKPTIFRFVEGVDTPQRQKEIVETLNFRAERLATNTHQPTCNMVLYAGSAHQKQYCTCFEILRDSSGETQTKKPIEENEEY